MSWRREDLPEEQLHADPETVARAVAAVRRSVEAIVTGEEDRFSAWQLKGQITRDQLNQVADDLGAPRVTDQEWSQIMNQKPVSASRAAEQTELLHKVGRELADANIRYFVYLRERVREDGGTIPPGEAYNPTELVAYELVQVARAKVTIQDCEEGRFYCVLPADDSPNQRYPVTQPGEAAAYLVNLIQNTPISELPKRER